jgi:hypothetical protein
MPVPPLGCHRCPHLSHRGLLVHTHRRFPRDRPRKPVGGRKNAIAPGSHRAGAGARQLRDGSPKAWNRSSRPSLTWGRATRAIPAVQFTRRGHANCTARFPARSAPFRRIVLKAPATHGLGRTSCSWHGLCQWGVDEDMVAHRASDRSGRRQAGIPVRTVGSSDVPSASGRMSRGGK